jgi:hypothetical protein
MDAQLALIEEPPAEWRLDDRTRDLGLRGIASARAALAEAGRAESEHRTKRAA